VNSILLKFLDFFKPIYYWQKIDYDQLRAIVGIKLTMDNRRDSSFKMGQYQEDASSSFILTIVFFGILGGAIAFLIGIFPSIILAFSFYHLCLMAMITLTLISDFSSVLLDTSDNTILLPRPIASKTFFAARATHIVLYIGQMGLALSIFPIIVTFFKYGFSAGVFTIVSSILNIVFSIALTNGLYLLLMRLTSEERLKSIINYFQIGMTIFIMASSQILPRVLLFGNLEKMATDLAWWFVFFPPMWFAGATKFFIEFNFDWIYLAATFLSVAVPVVSWWAIGKYLSPYFVSKISDLGTASIKNHPVANKKPWINFSLGNLITQPGLERAAYTFTKFAYERDRKLKLRIYPSMGYSFIMILVVFLSSKSRTDATWFAYIVNLKDSEIYLFALYACIFVVVTVPFEINFSDDYKCAWIFQSTPIEKPGYILVGGLKSIMAKFFLPLYTFTSFIILLIWKEKAIVDIVFGFMTCWLLMLLMAIISDQHLPLSVQPSARNREVSALRAIVSIVVIGVVSAGHYFLTQYDLVLWLATPVIMLISYLLIRRYKQLSWDEVQ